MGKYQEIVKLYNKGTKSAKEISRKLGINRRTVETYISKAIKDGDIVKVNRYEEFLRIYNEEQIRDSMQIAKKMNITEKTVRRYMDIASEKGKIVRISNYEQFERLYYEQGIRDIKVLSKMLKLSEVTIQNYIYRTIRDGNNENDNIEPIKEVFDKERLKQIADTNEIDSSKIESLILLLKKKFPYEVAHELNIPAKKVYDILENVTDEEKKEIIRIILSNNETAKKINNLRKDGTKIEDAIRIVETSLRGVGKLELANIYYVMGQRIMAERVLNKIIFAKESTETMKALARKKMENIKREFIITDIRKEKKNFFEKYGVEISYEALCKKYNVRSSLLIEILGREEICL